MSQLAAAIRESVPQSNKLAFGAHFSINNATLRRVLRRAGCETMRIATDNRQFVKSNANAVLKSRLTWILAVYRFHAY